MNSYCAGIRWPETETKFSDEGISRSANEASFPVQGGDTFFCLPFLQCIWNSINIVKKEGKQ